VDEHGSDGDVDALVERFCRHQLHVGEAVGVQDGAYDGEEIREAGEPVRVLAGVRFLTAGDVGQVGRCFHQGRGERAG
jgi:hypothetical protein